MRRASRLHLKAPHPANGGVGSVAFVTTLADVVVVLVDGALLTIRRIIGTVVHVFGVAVCRWNTRTVVHCAHVSSRGAPCTRNTLLDTVDLIGSTG